MEGSRDAGSIPAASTIQNEKPLIEAIGGFFHGNPCRKSQVQLNLAETKRFPKPQHLLGLGESFPDADTTHPLYG